MFIIPLDDDDERAASRTYDTWEGGSLFFNSNLIAVECIVTLDILGTVLRGGIIPHRILLLFAFAVGHMLVMRSSFPSTDSSVGAWFEKFSLYGIRRKVGLNSET